MTYKEINLPNLKFRYIIYEDASVVNLDKNKELKPYKDKRRTNESPMIYLKKNDDSRYCLYLDKLMISTFTEYNPNDVLIIHKNGDINDSSLDNLLIYDINSFIKNILKSNRKWKRVYIENIDLYYHYYISEDGELLNADTFSLVQPFIDKRNNIKRFHLYIDKRDTINISTHRLVALMFISNKPENKTLVYFRDGDTMNTHYSNLSWGDVYDKINNTFLLNREEKKEITTIYGKEKWKKINDNNLMYDYYVSSYGRVYNETHGYMLSISSRGSSNNNNQSWLRVSLKQKNGKYKSYLVHRLVGFAFVKNLNPKLKTEINHINGNPECNWDINLEWVTPIENLHHAIETNLLYTGLYESDITSELWRLKTIVSWCFSLSKNIQKNAYRMYIDYINNYEMNMPEFNFDEFIKYYDESIKSDKDFIKIFNYYNSEI